MMIPSVKSVDKIEQYASNANTPDKSSQQMQSNQWVTNGALGSKDAVLVFRTSVLSATADISNHNFDHPELYPETPSTSSTYVELSKAGSEKAYVSALSLPQSMTGDRKIDTETFNFIEKKTKKRAFIESSTSSSSSLNSRNSEGHLTADEGSCDLPSASSKESEDDNKENVVVTPLDKEQMPANLFNVTYKFLNTETRLLRKILSMHGMTEIKDHDSTDFNLLWTGNQLKPDMLRNLSPYQRINHFPRSSELTRKDRLYKNIERMQHFRGFKHFDFIPQTFLLPSDYKELVCAHNKNKGPWIVKPAASSRGRGIYLAKTPEEIQSHTNDEQAVVSAYIMNPLCIDGHKCDVRIYAAVTMVDPLIIYIYEEGLVRIATVRYDNSTENLWNPCMHLCNYSINKYHTDYIKSCSARDEDVGHKWTLSALLRHLKNQGCNTQLLMSNIEDIIIKAIFACAPAIISACRMFVPYVTNCFELFGFDILIDDTLKPWLIEVNLSPSLGCDTPLDTKVKASLLTDLLTLVGIPAISPLMKASYNVKTRSLSNSRRINSADFVQIQQGKKHTLPILTSEELKIVKSAKSQMDRRGGFVRIYPAVDSMQKYGMFLDPVTGIPSAGGSDRLQIMIIPHNYNQMLFQQLFGNGEVDSAINLDSLISQRIQKYERTLVANTSIVIGSKNSNSKAQDETKKLRLQIRKLIENGDEMTVLQARRAFSQYLEFVLKRLSADGKHSEEQAILKFLHRIAIFMRQPFFIRNVNHNRILTKERGAMVAKLLGDYLHIYNKETEAYLDSYDKCGMIPMKLFENFISLAQESDLESMLTLHTNVTQQMPFLYNSCSNGIPAAPVIPVGPHGFLKSLACMAPGSHIREVWRTDLGKQQKYYNKKMEKAGKLSPIKKKVTLYNNNKMKERDRSGWLFN